MLVSVLLTSTVVLSFVPATLGYPGMGEQLAEIRQRKDNDGAPSTELLGDLRTLTDRQLTRTGKDIKNLLQDKGNPESSETYGAVASLGSAQCARDTCCVWKYIADDMAQLFAGTSGRCSKYARFAVRLGFHDAGAWNRTSAFGGADGSIMLTDEWKRADNNGLGEMVPIMQAWQTKYTQMGYPVSMADLIQMAANVATVVCPLGPRVRSFVGRIDNPTPNPEGLLPGVSQTANELIALFAAKTISPHDLVALIGAHTVSQQQFVDTSRALDPQDSTPGVWDVLFYSQTLGTTPTPQRVFKFPSDVVLSQHPQTRDEFKEFAGNGGQSHWNEDYARAYIRLSLLGVNNINNLTECTKVLPRKINSFVNPNENSYSKWLNSDDASATSKKASSQVNNGDYIKT